VAAIHRPAAPSSDRYERGLPQVPHVPDQSTSDRADQRGGAGDADDVGSIWQAVSERLRASVPEATYRLWLEPLHPAGIQKDTLFVQAPEGIRAWVERRYTALIVEAIGRVDSGLRQVSFSAPAPEEDSAVAATLNPNYTFERFVIGEGNRLAHASALAVAEAPSEAYNPLFLHGPPGLGKTHLLAAIANYLRESAPQLNVRYTTAEWFTNEFVGALQVSGSDEFKRRYRDIDVLLIDDVQFLEGKRHTEEEFFHTFNALYEAGSQLVLSADRIPSELSTLAERLRDRFEWGLTVAVDPPNLATRLIVLRRLVREAGVEVADNDALMVLARRIDANVRQLHGALTRVIAHASLRARPFDSDLVEEVISPEAKPASDPVEAIQEAVGEALQLPRSALTGPSRSAKPLRARQLAIYLCREMTDLSLPQIGRAFGGRDHATVLNALRRVEERRAAGDPNLERQLDELRADIHKERSAVA
jgi:chromosomal replication initiator protein